MTTQPAPLIFVYNADSGVFNALTDVAHKIFSPQTYNCNLCAVTHTAFGMRREWRDFLATLAAPLEFLHADELKNKYGVDDVLLPVVFQKRNASLEILLGANEINACRTLEDLKQLIIVKTQNAPYDSPQKPSIS